MYALAMPTPVVRALTFRPEGRRQDRINWQIRRVEGDLTPYERAGLAAALSRPWEELTVGGRAAWPADRRAPKRSNSPAANTGSPSPAPA
jgi:hypothetical protein